MNVFENLKSDSCFSVHVPVDLYEIGDYLVLKVGDKITMDHVDPPRTYIAKSQVGFLLTDDSHQLDKISVLELIEPKPLMTEPKPGETWRRKVQHSSDESYNFACVAHDDEQTKWFVWHASNSGRAFVISKDDFFDDRNNWEKV